MIWEAWVTLLLIGLVMAALLRGSARAEVILLTALAVLVTLETLSPGRFLTATAAAGGFGNPGLVTIGFLFVLVAGLKRTGAMELIIAPLLGKPRSVLGAQLRMILPVASISPFMNNTPVVAMFMPVVSDWCKKTGISPSKLFIPLSYATVLGGMVSLIGTSTNLVVNGLLIADVQNNPAKTAGHISLKMFDPAWVGLPCAIVGIVYLLIASRWLLPDRQSAVAQGDARQYTVEMLVEPGSPLAGQSIEKAGLRHLPGLYLTVIDRQGEHLPAVSSREKLQQHDRLIFVGVVESIVDLQRIRGLCPATNQVAKLDSPRTDRQLIEAVVSNTCPLVGKTVRESGFRSHYNAAIIAIARNGQRLNQKIGDISLHTGDTLLLEAHPDFAAQQRNSRDFYLVSLVDDSAPPGHERAWVALLILAVMVALVTTGVISMLLAAMLAALGMVVTRCCTAAEASKAVDWNVLIMIGAALGLGAAVQNSTLAQTLADHAIALAGQNPWVVLAIVYFMTLLFTELVTNNAAAVLIFPIAMAAARTLGLDVMPFVMAVMVGASAGFATPLGYQTHMMVFGPGGYRFSDFIKIGLPLDLVIAATALIVIPIAWPLVVAG